MKRLGYAEFVAQGGDWGAAVSRRWGSRRPRSCSAFNSNMPGTAPADLVPGFERGEPAAVGPVRRRAGRVRAVAHLLRQARRLRPDHDDAAPDAVRLADSPIDLAAFAIDHGDGTGQPGLIGQIVEGRLPGDLTRDDILDNITLYWLTNTGVVRRSVLLGEQGGLLRRQGHHHPVRHQRLPRRALPGAAQLGRCGRTPTTSSTTTGFDRGGHFAAWRQPQLFSEEMRASFRSLRR